MTLIKGIKVNLYTKVQINKDGFGQAIYELVSEPVENVLVSPSTPEDVSEQLNLTGRRAEYTLAIPKGDNHRWEDAEVEFFGKRWKVFTNTIEGIASNIPLSWNKKVMVERHE